MADLTRGANAPVTAGRLDLAVAGARQGAVDLLVLQLGADRKVRSDADLVFFNNPVSPEGAVRLAGPDRVELDLRSVPAGIDVLVIAVALDDAVSGSLADIRGLGVDVSGADQHTAWAAGLTTERAAVLAEIYRRAGAWKMRNVSAGWTAGLGALVLEHGVVIDGPGPAAASAPPTGVPPAAPTRVARPGPTGPVGPPATQPPSGPPLPAPCGWPAPGGVLAPPPPLTDVPRPGGFPAPGGEFGR